MAKSKAPQATEADQATTETTDQAGDVPGPVFITEEPSELKRALWSATQEARARLAKAQEAYSVQRAKRADLERELVDIEDRNSSIDPETATDADVEELVKLRQRRTVLVNLLKMPRPKLDALTAELDEAGEQFREELRVQLTAWMAERRAEAAETFRRMIAEDAALLDEVQTTFEEIRADLELQPQHVYGWFRKDWGMSRSFVQPDERKLIFPPLLDWMNDYIKRWGG